MMRRPIRGQGALEYLLLIGGAVLVATVILVMSIGSTTSTTTIINGNINAYTGAVSLNSFDWAGGGSTANLCGTPSEFCASGSSQACTGGAFSYSGTQSCNATCSAYGSCDIGTQACGDGSINGTEVCDTLGDLGCSGGTPVCNACVSCVASGSDTTPPVFTTILVTPGNGQATVTFLATDSSAPVNYSLGYATTSSGAISTYTTTSNGTGVTVIPGPVSPQVLSGLTNGVSYDVVVRACDSATPVNNCALTAVQPVTPNPPLPYISAFSVTPLASTLGYANYSFNWTVNPPLPSTYKEPIGGIVSLTNTFIPNGTFIGNDAAYSAGDAYINRNPASGSAPLFSLSAGTATGTLSAQAIKVTIEALGGVGPYFAPVAESASAAGNMYAVGDSVLGAYPADTDPPASATLNGSTSTAFNGGAIDVSYVNPSDQYLGVGYSSALLGIPGDATVAYSNSPISSGTGAAVAAFDALPSTAKKIILAAPVGATMSDVLNYNQGIVPSSSGNYIGVKICDLGDGLTATPAGSLVNCRIISSGPTPASKEAEKWEAETGTAGSSILVPAPTYQTEAVAQVNMTGCTAAGVNMTYSVDLKAPAAPNATYTVWVRGANALASATVVREYFKVTMGGVSKTLFYNSTVAGNAPLAWSKATTTLSSPGLTQAVRLDFTDGTGTPTCTNVGDLRIDKILVTTDSACTPTGAGTNCQ